VNPDELGLPVAPPVLADGVPVFDRDGERVGVVDRVISDDATGIFEGLVVHTLPLPGRHVYAGHEQIAELREHGVLLAVASEELHPLGPRDERARREDAPPEHPLERRLRRAWDRLIGMR
jgi:hypothetical protein